MSSSVFIESSSIPKAPAESLEGHVTGGEFSEAGNSADSNLVVVYGKNGINFDRKGLENLIEEKTLSSISVIRLTSPTPSMEAEEEEAERQEELKRKQDIPSDDDESESSDELAGKEDNFDESDEKEELSIDERESSSNEDEEGSADETEKSVRRKKKSTLKKSKDTRKKIEKIKRKRNKERPEIVGLTVEEFYPPEDAQKMAKEILKLAGVSTIKRTADFEFQLYVIRNDHCYTPFTSPAQMKAKLAAEKLDAEKTALTTRKHIPQSTVSVKQLITKKMLQNVDSSKSLLNRRLPTIEKERTEAKAQLVIKGKLRENPKKLEAETNEYISDDNEIHSSASEDEHFESEYSSSDVSAESENDRDSDLDFDLNNRKGRKRKVSTLKTTKRIVQQKSVSKRNQRQSQDDTETTKSIVLATKSNRQTNNDNLRVVERKNLPTTIAQPKPATGNTLSATTQLKNTTGLIIQKAQPPQDTPSPVIKKLVPDKTMNPVTHQITIAAAVRRGPIVQVGTSTPRSSQLSHASTGKVPASPQKVKEIVINKVMASPKGGFTEIGSLLSQPDIQTAPLTPTSARSHQKTTPSSKGFMPLGIETAAKNQLPSQISIQTHQSSSELAAEQLDLIDSIVKDEMEKCSIIEKAPGVNENIPQLVKMLESTEIALESKKTQQINNTFTTARSVEDIDITNAPLLETPEDEIPDDLLQHVVELIEDDKTLQEAVEKQVFGEVSNVSVGSITQTLRPPDTTTPIFQQTDSSKLKATEEPKPSPIFSPQTPSQTKSIIQATLSNIVTTPSPSAPFPAISTFRPLSSSKLAPTIRKEPIQIIRGNGRVITLPPIEAPTTRAKRRAQTQPQQNVNTSLGDALQIALSESQDTSMQSNASISTDSGATNISSIDKKQIETATSRRRVSKEGTVMPTTVKTAKKVTKKVTAKSVIKNDAEEGVSESQEDDDDPNKLWCICRQPHNNRFMICCDVCEDWFHGTCVSITKAMGLEMEQRGVDWTCPKCVKKIEDKKQPKITDMLESKKNLVTQQPVQSHSVESKDQTADTTTSTQNNDSGAVSSASSTTEPIPKKQIIDIKKIQSGQFISLKNFEQKKLPVTVLTSGQKKQLPITTTAVKTIISPTTTPAKRVIVVQKMPGPKNIIPNKTITLVKSPHQQQLKLQKVQVSAAHPSTSTSDRPAVENVEPITPCIVCKKAARPNSIYCSDDCIRKHAQNALNTFSAKSPEPVAVTLHSKLGTDDKKKKPKGLFEDLLSMADRKPKAERVYVFERKSGRVLTGNNAPTTINLKKWLQDNPTFEVVQPGSVQAIEIEKKQKQRSTVLTKTTDSPIHLTSTENEPITVKKSATLTIQKTDGPTTSDSVIQAKHIKQLIDQSKSPSATAPRPGTPKQLTKYPQQVTLKPDKPHKPEAKDEAKSKEKNVKRQSSETGNKKAAHSAAVSEVSSSTTDSEPIRLNVRRTLKEQLCQRITELALTKVNEGDANTKLSSIEVEQFVKETESEMYNLFNRDTGAKYKAKYRSLMFNIKDRKNKTLFQKICAKLINPKQLVRMTPEELASQELAQWRENENKHQLEMIKKSELDLLSCAKNYVLKTHKGEEVIEGKSTDCVNLDLTIPVEDVVSVLNNSSLQGGEQTEEIMPRKDYIYTELDNSRSLHIKTTSSGNAEEKVKPVKDREREQERDREYERDREREKRYKSKERHREKSKSRKRSRSRSRSRSREKRHKSSHKDDKRDRDEHDRDKGREKDRERERGRPRERHERKTIEKNTITSTVISPVPTKSSTGVIKEKHKESNVNLPQAKKDKGLEAFNLIDQILESSKTVEEAANLVIEKKETVSQSAIVTSHSSATQSTTSSLLQSNIQNSDSDQEPTSTVSITSSPQDPYNIYTNDESTSSLWSGNINMIDVASFQIVVQSVVGNSVNLGKLLPDELDVVGRIGPETVWDYISKIKKSPNKEIVIVRLVPAFESETVAYTILYQYLHKRNRLGVIKTTSSQIKDFYIFPLEARSPMPIVLQPSERVEFYEDPYRPDMLLGIVIRVIGKRISTIAPSLQGTGKTLKVVSKSKDSDSFTPPGSPKRKRSVSSTRKVDMDIDAIIKAPIVTKKNIGAPVMPANTAVDDQDEPYSPGGSSEDDLPLLPVKTSEFHKTAEDDLKRQMDEINKQIAVQEMEIAGLLNVEPSKFTSSTNTSALNPSLASISIPSNLSQILASINSKPEPLLSIVPPAPPGTAPPPPLIGSLFKTFRSQADDQYNNDVLRTEKPAKSRLAQLSEAELLSMVPDDMLDQTASSSLPPAVKKQRYDEPPPPGV